jgi:hypothetical protein
VGVRKRLLATPADRVPDHLAAAVVAFCEPIAAIRAGYVALLEVTEGFGHPREQLAVAFELTDVGEATLALVAERFVESMPQEIQAGGCNVLQAGALGVWGEHARRVFARGSRGLP